MARPTATELQAGVAGWDAIVNDNFDVVLGAPFPIPLHTGDESDLQATFAAAAYDKCWIWVEHSIDGWTIYESDGTTWAAKTFGGGGGGAADSVLAPISIAVTDEISTLASGTSIVTFQMPDDFTLVSIHASLSVASSSGLPAIDVNKNGSSIFTTDIITIDATEKTSLTATTPPNLTTTDFAQGDEITIDIDGTGTGAKGLKVYMVGVYSNTFPNYSTTETPIGVDWTNGDPIYRKTVAVTLPNATTQNTAHSISTISKVVKMEGRYLDASSDWQTLPRTGTGGVSNDNIQLSVDGTNIMLRSDGNHSGGSEATVDIYYTKA